MPSSIYLIRNKVNSNFYIGKTTKTIHERFRCHQYNSKSQNTHLYNAFRKYGIENFTVESLEETDKESLNDREIYWITKLQPHYNMTSGGDGGNTSNSQNYKIGMSKRDISGDKNGMYGRKRDNSKFQHKAAKAAQQSNRCPVICEDIVYSSVGEAQTAYPGINIRKRLDNPKYPHFYRLRERTKRK